MAYENLKSAIKQAIKNNNNQEITGDLLQSTLLNIVNTIGADYKFLGFANSSTIPPTSEEGRLLYFTTGHGDSYMNFPTSASGTYITLEYGIYALTREANSKYWKSDAIVPIAQELGTALDKIMSQKAVSDKFNELSSLVKAESDKFNELSSSIPEKGFIIKSNKAENILENAIKKGDCITVTVRSTTAKLSCYAYRENVGYTTIFESCINSSVYSFVAENDFTNLHLYIEHGSYEVFIKKTPYASNEQNIDAIFGASGEVEVIQCGNTLDSIQNYVINHEFTKGEYVKLKISPSPSRFAINIYTDKEYNESGNHVGVKVDANNTFRVPVDGYHLRFWKSEGFVLKGKIYISKNNGILRNESDKFNELSSSIPEKGFIIKSNKAENILENAIKKGDCITVTVRSTTAKLSCYAYRENVGYTTIFESCINSSVYSFVAENDFTNLHLYIEHGSYEVFIKKTPYASNEQNIDAIFGASGEVEVIQCGNTLDSIQNYVINHEFTKGEYVKLKISPSPSRFAINIYTDKEYNESGNHVGVKVDANNTFRVPVDGYHLRFWKSEGFVLKGKIYISKNNGILRNERINLGNVLIIGDSYSEQNIWINKLYDYVYIKSLVNVAKSSGTLKDIKKDRSLYPYTSRPYSSGSTNTNTFACQIEKIKRLMKGIDLDAGEKQIYKDVSDYPDIILIEGGKNDIADKNFSLNTYTNILYELKENVYYTAWGNEPKLGSVYITKNIDDIDRTTFIGAMYYLVSSLRSIFGKEVNIWFINPSNLFSANSYNPTKDIEVTKSIELAASILSIPVIDWNRKGKLSFAFENLSQQNGDGTKENPYRATASTYFTNDMLHPNDKGANILAKIVAEDLIRFCSVTKK